MRADLRSWPNAPRRRTQWMSVVVVAVVGCSADVTSPRASSPRSLPTPSLDVAAAAEPVLSVVTQSLPDGQVGQPYDFPGHVAVVARGPLANRPVTWALSQGQLPAGLALDPKTGNITGTPTTKGCANGLVFTATDAKGNTADSRKLSICIDDPRFAVFVQGSGTKGAPLPTDKSFKEKRAVTLHIKYFVNGVAVEKRIDLTLPANATAADLLKAIEPAIKAALGADFEVTLQLGAANPRIDIVAKAGVTIGANRPDLGGKPPTLVFTVTTGKLRVSTALANQR